MTAQGYELRRAASAEDFAAYHSIRRSVLFDARGRVGYDETYPAEKDPANWPLLLLFRGIPVCAFRLDVTTDGTGIIRLMAVDACAQRQGHGRAAIILLIEIAKGAGLNLLEVNSAPDAVNFYQRMGFLIKDAARESPLLHLPLSP
jgi:GNAT superfamily N-acetyltransferase